MVGVMSGTPALVWLGLNSGRDSGPPPGPGSPVVPVLGPPVLPGAPVLNEAGVVATPPAEGLTPEGGSAARIATVMFHSICCRLAASGPGTEGACCEPSSSGGRMVVACPGFRTTLSPLALATMTEPRDSATVVMPPGATMNSIVVPRTPMVATGVAMP